MKRFQRLVDYLYQEKHNGKIQRLIKAAKLRFPQEDLFNIYYEGRTVDRQQIEELMTCEYIDGHQSVTLQRSTGSGKTFIACALGKRACQQQIQTKYIRLPDLLMEYGGTAILAGQPQKLLKKYARYQLLILDEWLVSDISDAERYFLFELIERRSDTKSTIFCTQYRKDDWLKRLGDGVQAEAICC